MHVRDAVVLELGRDESPARRPLLVDAHAPGGLLPGQLLARQIHADVARQLPNDLVELASSHRAPHPLAATGTPGPVPDGTVRVPG